MSIEDDFDPYDNLYEASFGGGKPPETRKVPKEELDSETMALIEQHRDEGVTYGWNGRARRVSMRRLERAEDGKRTIVNSSIHVRRPRIPNPLATAIVKTVTRRPMLLTIDLGDGIHHYGIRRLSDKRSLWRRYLRRLLGYYD